MQWFYAINGQRQGPVSQAELTKLVAAGTLKAEALVWHEGLTEWRPYSQVAPAADGTIPTTDPDTEVCSVSGKRYPKREMIQYEGRWISAEHRDAFFQRLREGWPSQEGSIVPGPFGYGGFWRRVVARIVDAIICGIMGMFVGMIGAAFIATGAVQGPNSLGRILLQITVQLTSMGLGILYEVQFIRKYDATPGKLAMGMKVFRTDGSKLTVGRIIGRYFSQIVDSLTIGIGYLIAAFDEEKRTLHDRICDTRVIKSR